MLTIQPDLALASDGFLDALALQTGASLTNPFTLTFVWLGTGLPSSQPFTIYDANFATIAQSQTIQVPLALQITPPSADRKFWLIWSPASAILEESGDLVTWTTVAGAVSPLALAPNDPAGSHYYRIRGGP